jgi:hypothetical protein
MVNLLNRDLNARATSKPRNGSARLFESSRADTLPGSFVRRSKDDLAPAFVSDGGAVLCKRFKMEIRFCFLEFEPLRLRFQ